MLKNLQLLRAIAAISVLFYHVLETAKSYKYRAAAFSFLEGWGASGVDLFFVISGFVMVYTQARKPRSSWNFLKNRFVRIVPLYWFLTLMIMFAYLAWPSAFREMKLTAPHLISSLLFLSKKVMQDNPILSVGWTLEYEILFYLLFALALMLTRTWVALTASALLIGMWLAGSMDLLALEFVLGMLAATIYLRRDSNPAGAWIFLAGAALLSSSLFLNSHLHSFWTWGVPSFLIVLGACYLPQSENRLARILGDASYSTYLVQVFTIPVFYKAVKYSAAQMPSDLMAILCVVLSASVSVLVYYLIEKKLVSAAKYLASGSWRTA